MQHLLIVSGGSLICLALVTIIVMSLASLTGPALGEWYLNKANPGFYLSDLAPTEKRLYTAVLLLNGIAGHALGKSRLLWLLGARRRPRNKAEARAEARAKAEAKAEAGPVLRLTVAATERKRPGAEIFVQLRGGTRDARNPIPVFGILERSLDGHNLTTLHDQPESALLQYYADVKSLRDIPSTR